MHLFRQFRTNLTSLELSDRLRQLNNNEFFPNYKYVGDNKVRLQLGRGIVYWNFDFSQNGIISASAKLGLIFMMLPVLFLIIDIVLMFVFQFNKGVVASMSFLVLFECLIVWINDWFFTVLGLNQFVKQYLNKEK